MTDPYATRVAAAKRRLAEADEVAAEITATQKISSDQLDALDAQVEGLAKRLGVDVERPGDPPLSPALPESQTAPSATSDPAVEHLRESKAFSLGHRDDLAYLTAEGVHKVRWDDLLSTAEIANIDAHLRRPVAAEAMTRGDLITVGVCASLGVVAVLLDDSIDGFVKDRLCDLHDPSSALGHSGLGKAIRQWDKAGKNLAVDYGGQGIGGGHGVHRVRSAGHDLLRPFQAIEQIRSGQFQGHRWEDGIKIAVGADRPHLDFAPYRQIETVNEAILIWMQHLASDFTTSKSLPLPGATFLHDSPRHAMRSLGAESYKGGLNLRRVLITGVLPVATVEAGVRLSVLGRTWQETGSAHLTPERKAKLENMLLLTHGVVAAASAGKVAVAWQAEGPAALRHLNVAVLSEVGRYALPVMVRHVRRNDPVLKFDRNERELLAGWDRLLADDGFIGAIHAFETLPPLVVTL